MASRLEPALKPNQPTHSREAPIIVIGSEWGGIRSLPWPIRLPTMMAADEAGDTSVDMHDGAACEVNCAPQEDLTRVSHHCVEGFLCGLLGGIVGCSSQCLCRSVNRVWAGPVPNHVRDREVDQGNPQRDEQRKRRELACVLQTHRRSAPE